MSNTKTASAAATTTTNKNEWTWQEISEHDRRESCWIYIEENVYDVTSWLSKHPAGEETILLFGGRDCTECMRAYHPFTDKPYAILEKYKIGTLKGPSEVVRWNPDTGFYKTVRDRCGEYFKKRGVNPTEKHIWYELCRLFLLAGYLYAGHLNMKTFREWGVPLFIRLLFGAGIGFIAVLIALHIGHLCSHIPTFHRPKLNYYIGWFSLDACMGYSYDIWLHEHVVGHHQYTNIITVDPNVPEGHGEDATFRCSPNQQWYKRFNLQFIYVPLLAFFVLVDYRLAPIRYWRLGYRKEIRVSRAYRGFGSFCLHSIGKLIWAIRVFFIPCYYWGLPLWEAILLIVIGDIAAGYYIGINLPANHTTNDVDWPLPKKDEKGGLNMGSEWAVSQVETCKDYAYDSWVLTHILGALNNHSCHHLFPALHHSYYLEIYPIVKQAAKEWNVKTPDVGTYWDVLVDFVQNLWDLGCESTNPKLKYL